MQLLKNIIGQVIIASLFLISCSQGDGKKFLGSYSSEKNGATVFTITNTGHNSYKVELVNIKTSKSFVFNYNSTTKTLVSSSNDTISLNDKDELRFNREDEPQIFYKIK